MVEWLGHHWTMYGGGAFGNMYPLHVPPWTLAPRLTPPPRPCIADSPCTPKGGHVKGTWFLQEEVGQDNALWI